MIRNLTLILFCLFNTFQSGFCQINPTVIELGAGGFDTINIQKQISNIEKTTTFKISGINPLRYRYFINNVAVSQFMDNNPITTQLTSINLGNGIVIRDVKLPELFSEDTVTSVVRKRLAEMQELRRITLDSLRSVSMKITNAYNSRREFINYNTMDIKRINSVNDSISDIIAKNPETKKFVAQQNQLLSKRNIQMKEFLNYIYRLPIMNYPNSMLDNFLSLDPNKNNPIGEIDRVKYKFASNYSASQADFEYIESFLNRIEANHHYVNSPEGAEEYDSFLNLLRRYKFIWERPDITSSHGFEFRETVNSIREQMLEKRFFVFQDFILNTTTKIGMLMQNTVLNYTSFHNTLVNYKSLNDRILSDNRIQTDSLKSILRYVKQTNSEIQILMAHLDVNLGLYKRMAKQINENFITLLPYLRDMELLIIPNTTEILMPISTNFRNVDIIRYSVKREDVILKTNESVDYDYWIRGGLKIDFSVGILGSMLIDDIYNKVLVSSDSNGVDSIHINRQKTGKADFAFGGMVNIIPRNGRSWINSGFSVGVAYASNKSLQFLTGLSLHLGKTERIILHGGVAFGRVNRIDESASMFSSRGGDFAVKSKDVKFATYNIPYYQKFEARGFFGISYNLSKKNALQAVSGSGLSTYNSTLSPK